MARNNVGGIPFTKMHGLGNDYVFVDLYRSGGGAPFDPAELSREVSDRHFGIGSDGLILILPSDKADFRMRIFNADGSEGEMCGNGIRCFAKYVYEQGYTRLAAFSVETGGGIIVPEVFAENGRVRSVRVDMGEPRTRRYDIPMEGPPADQVIDETLEVGGRIYRVTAVSMGNPHCVIFVDDLEAADVNGLGPLIENHPAFPRRTNVEFVQVKSPSELVMRVWERGSGVTLACGTGACASLVAAALTGRASRRARVRLPGGDLDIEWADDGHVYMTGPAVEVFRGVYQPR